ncbi:CHAT domain-containing protein [Streptomyces sp. NPDC090045]|uniref:CHAT domain-containing protein n=1 Tax=Streptomyces sp. NPDC090045 TaxID=3365927 RepID=UPI0037F6FB60
MNRTVLSFEPLGDQVLLKLEDAPTDIPGLGEHAVTDVSDPPGGTIVERGKALLDRLALHPAVGQGLAAVLALPPGAAPGPLYFHMLSSHADRLPWELLFDPVHGFCALDRRWPIVRIAARRRGLRQQGFAAPLRMVAVLSAAGRSGLPQLATLLDATATADAKAVQVRLHVISGDQEVLDAVTAAGRPEVTSELIPPTEPELRRSITAARPHILHLLCHGGAGLGGVRTLAFAHLADVEAAKDRAPEGQREPDRPQDAGSVRIKVPELITALEPADPWLVVLSACQTAEASETQAMAHELVSNGVPAVAGMRRLVDLHDTNRFCAALYPEVLAAVRAAISPNATLAREVDWAVVFTAPRLALAGQDPAAADSWTDPVLYVQADPLLVFPGSAALSPADFSTLQGQLDVWQQFVATLDPATADPGLLEKALERIAELHAALGVAGP